MLTRDAGKTRQVRDSRNEDPSDDYSFFVVVRKTDGTQVVVRGFTSCHHSFFPVDTLAAT